MEKRSSNSCVMCCGCSLRKGFSPGDTGVFRPLLLHCLSGGVQSRLELPEAAGDTGACISDCCNNAPAGHFRDSDSFCRNTLLTTTSHPAPRIKWDLQVSALSVQQCGLGATSWLQQKLIMKSSWCSVKRRNNVEAGQDAQIQNYDSAWIFLGRSLKGNDQGEWGAGQPEAGCHLSEP